MTPRVMEMLKQLPEISSNLLQAFHDNSATGAHFGRDV